MTTLDEDLQLIGQESFRSGLKSYSFRKGWNGPITNFSTEEKELFEKFKEPEGIYDDELALVSEKVDIKITYKYLTKKKINKNCDW